MATFCSLCNKEVSLVEKQCCKTCENEALFHRKRSRSWILLVITFFAVFGMLAKGMELYQLQKQQDHDVMIYIKSFAGTSD